MYDVTVIPDHVPPEFRSGMSANIDIIEKEKRNVLMLPNDAVKTDGGSHFVTVMSVDGKTGRRVDVEIGIADEDSTEIISGITEQDRIGVESDGFVLPHADSAKNPFQPQRPGGRRPPQ